MNKPDKKKISILLVEDETEIKNLLSGILGRIYETVITANNGKEGLEKYRAHSPDIIVTDIQMPVMDGLYMVSEIRQTNMDIPILVTSAFNDERNLLRAINIGVDRFLPKPVDMGFFKREIAKSAEIIQERRTKAILEEKMTILTQAILRSEDATCILSKSGEFVFFNDTFFQCFGKKIGEMIKTLQETIFMDHPEIREKLNSQLSNHWQHQFKCISCDGHPKDFDLKVSPIYTTKGEFFGSLMVFHDISNLVELEKKLEEEKKIAQQSSRFKAEFLSTVSHDIRTPIGLISGMADLMMNEGPSSDQNERLGIIGKSAQNLLHLVNDILDISKIEEGKLEIEKISFSLKDSLEYIKQLFQEKIKGKNLRFEIIYDPSVKPRYKGDPFRLQQIIVNLIGNSIKFTTSGHITLMARELPVDSSKNMDDVTLEFVVSDSGIGIAKERIGSIFNRYEQEEVSTARKYGGTGLGTSISKNLVELMGGAIVIESPAVRIPSGKDNPGTEFIFTIKVQKVIEEEMSGESNRVADETEKAIAKIREKKYSVLVAEDNPVNQLLLKKILNLFDMNIDVAHDGIEAFEKSLAGKYDAIFMDIEMPGMTGVEATEKLRNNDVQTPIIACSAHNFRDDIEGYLKSGMTGYLVKPVNKKAVLDAVLMVLGA